MSDYKPSVLQVKDPSTGEYSPIAVIKGDKGDKGDAPVRGTDYWTTEDKQEIIKDIRVDLIAATETELGGVKAPAKTLDQTVPVGIGDDGKLYVAPSGEEQVQSDWLENDPESPAYIKNRICYEATNKEEVLIPMQDVSFTQETPAAREAYTSLSVGIIPTKLAIIFGEKYRIFWDGVPYDCIAGEYKASDSLSFRYLGNYAVSGQGNDTGEPFLIIYQINRFERSETDAWLVGTTEIKSSHSIQISKITSEVFKIQEKYLPPYAGRKTISGGEIFNNALDASGEHSHAEGLGTTASGDGSHAEGGGTTALGHGSHAEGEGSGAAGEDSHAEGYVTVARGKASHAEGGATEAIKEGSHAEGVETVAFSPASHAEGYGTVAFAPASHAEGYGTVAFGICSHAEGAYNLMDSDTGREDGAPNNKYAHIVGNGDSEETRSDAHTLDWQGNAWYQGRVLVGGTDMDAPDAELTPTSVIIKSSTPDSFRRFKITVDDNGTIKVIDVTKVS